MAISQTPKDDSGKLVNKILIEHIVEEILPPARVKSKFKSLNSWLFNICDSGTPKKSIEEFRLSFFESAGEYTLFLIGINTYYEGKNRSTTRIEFKPPDMYFKLPKSEYKKLNREQVKEKLTSQLKDFTTTEKFKTSFLANASAIVAEFSGERIWSNSEAGKN